MLIRHLTLLLSLTAFSFSTIAQNGGYSLFRSFTVADGLPTNHIYTSVEDDHGFLWVATDAGIARFDGKHFQVFTVKNGLPDNDVLDVVKENDGRIWVNCFRQTPAYFDEVENRFINASKDTGLARVSGTTIMYLRALPEGGVMYINEKGSFIFKDKKLVKIFYIRDGLGARAVGRFGMLEVIPRDFPRRFRHVSPRRHIPANPAIPITQLQRRGRKSKAAQPAMRRVDQVEHLRTHQGAGTLRMIAQHHLIPYPHLGFGLHNDQCQPTHIARLCRHIKRSRERLRKTSRALAANGAIALAGRKFAFAEFHFRNASRHRRTIHVHVHWRQKNADLLPLTRRRCRRMGRSCDKHTAVGWREHESLVGW